MREPRVVDRLVGELAGLGVSHVFGVGGANIEDLYDALHTARGGVRGVVAKHEFSAAAMADAYARVTGRLGVVAATSGGGAMNLVPGLAESYASRVPVLALVGQPETGLEGRGAFQDGSGQAGSLDAGRVFAAVSRFCARVGNPDALAELLPRAVTAARTDPAGPAVLLLPKDVQRAPAGRTAWPRPADPPAAQVDPAALDRALAGLRAATDVLVIAGAGVAATAVRAELAALARRLGAWVAVTPDAKDAFDNHDPRYAGVTGVMGHTGVESRMRRTDVCLLVGTRLPHLARAGLEEALADTSVISLGPEPPFVPALPVLGNLRSTLRALLDGLEPSDRPCPGPPGPQGQGLDRPRPRPPGAAHAGVAHPGVLSYAEAMAAIEAALPPDALVFVDAGNAGAAAIHHLPVPREGGFVLAAGMGGMGYAFGAGIGAALATGRRTYVLAGDGAFYMHGLEVHTAVQHDAPVTFVIFNNNAHGMCAIRERLYYPDEYSFNLFRPTDIGAGAAAAFPTLPVTRAADADSLRRALLRGNHGRGPALAAVDCDPFEVPPFLPFLAAIRSGTPEHPEPSEPPEPPSGGIA
ncbi:thiamine pyrophosphate-binding protein [Streptomyces sp. NPDC059874]|uniref:thiamine pyrophosphate-binding protein n=1 Tax=Streptomyces sp. NPDC059874 TaxID=3346983 RepID=UPI0036535379